MNKLKYVSRFEYPKGISLINILEPRDLNFLFSIASYIIIYILFCNPLETFYIHSVEKRGAIPYMIVNVWCKSVIFILKSNLNITQMILFFHLNNQQNFSF